jgi:hypothetical protein
MVASSIPTIKSLVSVLFEEQGCIDFLFREGVLLQSLACALCGGNSRRHGKQFRCTRDSCRKSVSIFNGTFFSGNILRPNEVMHLAYLWLTGSSSTTMRIHTGHTKATVSTYKRFFRELIANMIEEDDVIIGGPGIIVQVDETKLGKRKYERGHRVAGAWVIVGVEMTDQRRMFAEVVGDRSAETIEDVLERHLSEGSILQTDMWRGYSGAASKFHIEHRTVNHSRWFKDPTTGVDTNTVEGTNYAIKRSIEPRNRTKESLPSHLTEFVWRRKNTTHLWGSFIQALKEVAYGSIVQ